MSTYAERARARRREMAKTYAVVIGLLIVVLASIFGVADAWDGHQRAKCGAQGGMYVHLYRSDLSQLANGRIANP